MTESVYYCAPSEYYFQPQRLCARNLLKVCLVAGAWKKRIQQHFQKTFWFDCFDYRSPALRSPALSPATTVLNFVRKNFANQPVCPLPPSPWASVFQLTAHVSHGSESGGREHPSESGVAGLRHLELRGDMFLMSSTLLTATDGQTALSWAPLSMLSLPAFIKALWLGCDDGFINVGMGETDGSLSLKRQSSAGLWSQRRREKKNGRMQRLTSPERCRFCEPLRAFCFFPSGFGWRLERLRKSLWQTVASVEPKNKNTARRRDLWQENSGRGITLFSLRTDSTFANLSNCEPSGFGALWVSFLLHSLSWSKHLSSCLTLLFSRNPSLLSLLILMSQQCTMFKSC